MADEGEWEESLLLMELDGVIDNEWINKSGNKWKIIGIETETPLLQMNRYVFTGTYEDTVGTDVIFEVKDNQGGEGERHFADKPIGSAPQKNKLSYSCHMYKRLHMKRTFLNEKEEGQAPAATAGFSLTTPELNLQPPTTVAPSGNAESSSASTMDTQTETQSEAQAMDTTQKELSTENLEEIQECLTTSEDKT